MPSAHVLRISLDYSEPPVWRRVRVPSDCSLDDLHEIIQIVMGWTDSHMHQFEVGDSLRYQPPSLLKIAPANAGDLRDSTEATLGEVAGSEGDCFSYTYDFGDDWTHTILVEQIVPAESGKREPRVQCLAGERSGPPEDCGGIPGFQELLQVLADPGHEEHEELLDWLDEDYDPDAFDLKGINRELARLKL